MSGSVITTTNGQTVATGDCYACGKRLSAVLHVGSIGCPHCGADLDGGMCARGTWHSPIGPCRCYDGPQPQTISGRADKLRESKTLMRAYLLAKVEEEDWHGVQDAASDLRDIEAELKGLAR